MSKLSDCRRKAKHATRASALRHARHLEALSFGAHIFNVYPCRHCWMKLFDGTRSRPWHVGHIDRYSKQRMTKGGGCDGKRAHP